MKVKESVVQPVMRCVMTHKKGMTICIITLPGAFKMSHSRPPCCSSWGDFGLHLNQLIPNLGRVTPSCLTLSQCQSDNFPAPGAAVVLIGSPADFISSDDPWCPMKPYHRSPQGFWPPLSDHTWELCLPRAPFTCIIQHRQLGVAKPRPLHLMVHITRRLGSISHSVFALRSQFFNGEQAVNSSSYFFFIRMTGELRRLQNSR